jgi:hypothetical protein
MVRRARPYALLALAIAMLCAPVTRAAEDMGSPAAGDGGDRYMLGLLDRRSIYGKYWFPEPLLNPEMDVDREVRLDYFHSERGHFVAHELNFELEYSFGLLTLEAELPYVNEREIIVDDATGAVTRERTEGLGNVELAARHPVFQYVGADGQFDYTAAVALEVAIPTRTQISKDTELVPQLFQLVRFGEHASAQASVGYSFLIGPEEGGAQTLEYGLTLGYSFERDEVGLPGVNRITPLVELSGERGMNRGANGDSVLLGVVGGRIDLRNIGAAQPRLGVGYVFPIDDGAREELDWGIITSIVFEL